MTRQAQYWVQGSDSRQYPADAAALAEWIRTGVVIPNQPVFVAAENRWILAGGRTVLRGFFAASQQEKADAARQRVNERESHVKAVAGARLLAQPFSTPTMPPSTLATRVPRMQMPAARLS
ncbi:MAG TPA: hypothetical protein VKB93_26140 [Thermoanaerobaculia bacterium]|nr:hypothetical protein [Thermoanaerobaculia bacterium]